ncbi:hypothetical protein ASPCAL14936 [Aspergillus calidoustus]|uniref:Zn(2)-C6 fungal-type domain-containing protein n=1 Tax=Aspergillus calidoustus TaxID=454130 RepID=A0A0U5GJ89_ASPCI|nr:hypothetical protein ASPCAL14936 [Aspergillus calidoustus]
MIFPLNIPQCRKFQLLISLNCFMLIMSMRSQRILAPASTAPPPVALKPIAKRTKTSRACSACRERKIKCTGGVPCQMCRQNHTTCLIDPDTDNRRRNLLLQRISTLENTIANILETVRDEEKSKRFISVVRSNASFEQIQQVLVRNLSKDTSLGINMRPDCTSLKSQETRRSGPSDIRGLMAIDSLI